MGHMHATKRWLAGGLMFLCLFSSLARAESPTGKAEEVPPVETAGEGEAQPKFIWGLLLKFAASKAFEVFFDWASKKMFGGMALPQFLNRDAAVTRPGDATLAPAQKGGVTPLQPKVTDAAPATPLALENGRENYQGAMLSLLVLQPDGQTLAVRPLSEGFRSGERFRIRIGSTFGGELVLDNIDPHGARSRLYPADAAQIVQIKAGAPVILPLEKDSFFEFDEDAGEEQLIVTLRDPRAQGGAEAQSPVHRQENPQGTGLLQEVAAGKYAAIAEAIVLRHR